MRIFDGFLAMYEKIKYVPDTFLLLEMTVLNLALNGKQYMNKEEISKPSEKKMEKAQEMPQAIVSPKKKEEGEKTPSPLNAHFSFSRFVSALRDKKASLANDLKNTTFEQKDYSLTLRASTQWIYDRISTNEHRAMMVMLLKELFGGEWALDIRLNTETGESPFKNAIDAVF